MKITKKYIAALREGTQKMDEQLETSFKTVEEIYQQLQEKYHFPIERKNLRVAINSEYANFTDSIKEADVLVFIPPVAGG